MCSGLWGIFWYKEIKGCQTITNWFLAASITVVGILWLSQQRLEGTKGGGGGGDHRMLLSLVETAVVSISEDAAYFMTA